MISLKWSEWFQKWSNFTNKQREAERLADQYGFLLYGGESGGGKSYFLRKYPIKFLIEYCWHKLGLKGVRTGLFCEDYPALWDRHISLLKYEFPSWLGDFKGQTHEFVLDDKYGGGVIAFRNLDDPSKYLSAQFALMAVDELTKNPKETFDFLRLRKRWPGISKTKFIAGTNPGGIGHNFVKALWIDREFPVNEQEKDEFVFLKAGVDDNPYLPKEYIASLDSLPEKMRKAYREGNWDIFSGQYFTEWNKDFHTCPPFPIPKSWKKFRAYDHGREKPACCYWFALDYDGRVWVYREFYQAGLNVEEIAKEVNRLSEGEEYQWSVADSSIFAQQGMVDKSGGETIGEAFAQRKVFFIPSSKRRVDGWQLLHQFLSYSQFQPPKIIFFSNCINAIKTIPGLIHDEKNPEDLDSNGEDHSADAIRYFLTSLHEKKTPPSMPDLQKEMIKEKEQQDNFQNFYFNE